jgi:hypothetical protein
LSPPNFLPRAREKQSHGAPHVGLQSPPVGKPQTKLTQKYRYRILSAGRRGSFSTTVEIGPEFIKKVSSAGWKHGDSRVIERPYREGSRNS